MNTTIATKFVSCEIPPLETLADSQVYIIRQKLNIGDKLTRNEKNWLTEKINHNIYFNNAIPLGGWRFDFSDVMKTYVVKQYDHYQEYRAIDKTSLRTILCGRIDKIIKVV
ncbi:molybdenum ABC transporter ATP-binding protein [Parabacteroides sp. OttesenSCG-928-K15]|nr:molybdenum ABC transporter ATP-binding protein [Parabacteroides sp. OttesenSCG-928-K15]